MPPARSGKQQRASTTPRRRSSGFAVLIDADVDGAFGKARFAVAEVVNPFAAELLVEAELLDDVPALEEALAPEAQGLGVAEAEELDVFEYQPDALALLGHGGLGHQHATREDVALDEIGGGAVALEIGLVDGDGLNGGGAARLQAIEDGLEVGRPVLHADGLDHL